MTIENLLNAGGAIPVTLDASAAVGDLVSVHDGTGFPVKFLGRKTIPGNTGNGYAHTHSAELVGGRKVVLYTNINNYPCFRIYGPGMDELVPETVIQANGVVPSNMTLVAMSNGNFAVLFVDTTTTYPNFAILSPLGAIVKAVTQIEAVAWNGSTTGVRAVQLTGGNLVFAGIDATFIIRAAGRSADGNTALFGQAFTGATDQQQWDMVAARNSQNTWGLAWRTSGGAGNFAAFSAAGLSLGSAGGDTCEYVAVAASDDGYFWRAYGRTSLTPALVVFRHDPQAPATYLSVDVISNTTVPWYQVALACTSGNLCVVVTAQASGGFNIGIVGKMGTYSALYAHQKMTKYSWPTEASMVLNTQNITNQVAGHGAIFAASAPSGDVVVGCALYDTAIAGAYYNTVYLWKVDRNGYVLPRSMQITGYVSVGGTHRRSVVPTKNVLLFCFADRQQPAFYAAPLVPIVGAMSSAGYIKQSGKYTTPSGDWPKGQNLRDLPALCGHIVDAAFISGTDYILGS